MSRRLKVLASFVVAIALTTMRAQAAINIFQADSTSYSLQVNSGFTSWAVTPNTADTTVNATSFPNSNIALFAQPENNYGTTPVSALAQSFKATTSGNLQDVQIIVVGTPGGTTVNLALYDAGASSGNGLVDADNAYGNNTGVTAGAPFGSGSVALVSNNLLPTADSTGIVLPAANVQSSSGAAIFDFHMSGSDAVNIVAGEEYVFEISSPSSSQFIWLRNFDDSTNYANGQSFQARGPLLVGTDPLRDMSLAVTVTPVPEPGTMVLLGLSVPALLLAARKRK